MKRTLENTLQKFPNAVQVSNNVYVAEGSNGFAIITAHPETSEMAHTVQYVTHEQLTAVEVYKAI